MNIERRIKHLILLETKKNERKKRLRREKNKIILVSVSQTFKISFRSRYRMPNYHE